MKTDEEYMEGFDLYKETLRQMGIDIDQMTEVELMGSYTRYQNNLLNDEYENNKSINIETPLLMQLKDDVFNLVGQIKLLQQRTERLEDQIFKRV